MKTLNNLKRYFPVLALMLVLSVAANAQGNSYRNHERNEKKWENSRNSRKYKDWKHDNRREDYHPSYSKKWVHRQSDYYDHHDYGRVYRRFDREPVVIRYNRGDYYYYGNHFYTYRRGIGYCVTETPRNIYFSNLPTGCVKVRANGHLFFRTGDLYFTYSPRGYALVPAPVEFSVTARF